MIRPLHIFEIVFLTALSAGLSAAPAVKLPGLEGGMLKVKNVPAGQPEEKPEKETLPEIRDDGRNVPCYMEQAAMELGRNVTFRNRAIRGTGIQSVSRVKTDYLGDAPDLLVIAYGMNNFFRMPAEEFIDRMRTLISECRAVNPGTEYLLVSSMSGNPNWTPTAPGPDALYAERMRGFAAGQERSVALADVHKVWCKFLERKDFYDLTGNGVNHPNDYGHRIYASVVLELLTGKKYFD